MSITEKLAVLSAASQGASRVILPKSKVRISGKVIHTRFCAENTRSPTKYKFNINPNTLSADFELWVCGRSECYYLLPVAILRKIYDNPSTYVDNTHPDIRVISLDIKTNFVMYARGGASISIADCFRTTLTKLAGGA